jgi:hypothetical protein
LFDEKSRDTVPLSHGKLFLNFLLELALEHCFWGETSKSENFKLILFTKKKFFASIFIQIFKQCAVLAQDFLEKFFSC